MKANSSRKKKIIAITAGDPEGIGPEIIEKALKIADPDIAFLIIGNRDYFKDILFSEVEDPVEIKSGGKYFMDIRDGDSDPSFSYVRKATELAMEGKVAAIVTAPVNKDKWIKAGHGFMGHTDYFVKTTGVKKKAMFFWSEEIKTALFTTHIPLKDIFPQLTFKALSDFCLFVHEELLRITGKKFRFLVSGLNPHAGEKGNLGNEEIEIIEPVVESLRGKLLIDGPFPPDTIFLKALSNPGSVVISLYHDQGLIPFKLLKVNSGVNVTLGLPFVRTSPDHGTAYDIRGKGIADEGSMSEAIKLAVQFSNSGMNSGTF